MASCSGGSALAPSASSPQSGTPFSVGRLAGRSTIGYYSCPARGTIVYLTDSDATHSFIDVYAGRLAGQAPCGQITSGLNGLQGLYVDPATHDLYVPNQFDSDILVFHRGKTTPYDSYADTGQLPEDVTVANDGTIIASNISGVDTHGGSISTWKQGPNGGTFIGTFPLLHGLAADFGAGADFIAAQKNGTVYFDIMFDTEANNGTLWSVSCPGGACGVQTQVPGGALGQPGGVAVDNSGDVLVVDTLDRRVEKFAPPNPHPVIIPLTGIDFGLALDQTNNHFFLADNLGRDVAEYTYPNGELIGTAPCGVSDCTAIGVAVDR